MADNTTLNPGAGGDPIRSIAKSATGAKIQAVLLDLGGGSDGSPEIILTGGSQSSANSVSVTFASDISPLNLVSSVGAANIATGQVSIGTSATQIVAARTGFPGTGRVNVTLQNNGTAAISLGAAGVTFGAGWLLQPGEAVTIATIAAIYGITASGTAVVAVLEIF